jgi:hypothetical protein
MARGPHAALLLLSIALGAAILRNGSKKDARRSRRGKRQTVAAAEEPAAAVSVQEEPSAAKDIKSYYSFMTTVIVEADHESDVAEDTPALKEEAPLTVAEPSSSSWWQGVLTTLLNACSTALILILEVAALGLLHILLEVPLILLAAVVLVLIWLWECIKPQPYNDSTGSYTLHESFEKTRINI